MAGDVAVGMSFMRGAAREMTADPWFFKYTKYIGSAQLSACLENGAAEVDVR